MILHLHMTILKAVQCSVLTVYRGVVLAVMVRTDRCADSVHCSSKWSVSYRLRGNLCSFLGSHPSEMEISHVSQCNTVYCTAHRSCLLTPQHTHIHCGRCMCVCMCVWSTTVVVIQRDFLQVRSHKRQRSNSNSVYNCCCCSTGIIWLLRQWWTCLFRHTNTHKPANHIWEKDNQLRSVNPHYSNCFLTTRDLQPCT